MREIVQFVTDYENQIDVVVPVLRIVTDFSIDVAMFMIVRKLSDKEFEKFGEVDTIGSDKKDFWK